MNYEAPKLTRLGHVAALTASDIKCSPGNDFAYKTRWSHPNTSPWTHWTHEGHGVTVSELMTSGQCKWASDL